MPCPPQRFVYMKLDYHDSCPAEYEPPGFRPMDNANAVHFSRKPFYMCGQLYENSAFMNAHTKIQRIASIIARALHNSACMLMA